MIARGCDLRSPLIMPATAFRAGEPVGAEAITVAADITARIGSGYVRIGGLFLPPSQVVKTLHRYAKALVCENDVPEFPYTLRGTMAALNLGGRHFCVFCRHQIKDYDPAKVTLFPLAAGGSQHIGGGTGRHIERNVSNADEEFIDVFGIEFKPEAYTIENLGSEFFPVCHEDCWPTSTTGDLIAFGLPSALQNFNPREDEAGSSLGEVNFLTVVVSGRHRHASNARWVHEAEMIRTEKFPADGMSGGPVFHIGRDAQGLFIGLAGMIMRGSPTTESFYFIDTGFLRQFGET
jgi:hypothetical protein